MRETLLTVVRSRHSIRKYTQDSIPEQDVQELLAAAIQAPSAGNRQPWMFYVVKNPGSNPAFVEAAGYGNSFVGNAPLAIVVCAEPARSAERYKERGTTLYCLQDTAAAVEHILLAAAAMGYGTCWIGAFSEEGIAKVLGLPDTLRPVAIIPVGVPAEEGRVRPRRPLEEVVRYV